MTYEMYMWICYISAGFSVLMLIVSIFLFFKLKIAIVIGNLTGITAKKAIKIIRQQNSIAENSAYNNTKINHTQEETADKRIVLENNMTTILNHSQILNQTTILK